MWLLYVAVVESFDSWIGETAVFFQWLSSVCFPLYIIVNVWILLLAHVVVFILHTATPLLGIKTQNIYI